VGGGNSIPLYFFLTLKTDGELLTHSRQDYEWEYLSNNRFSYFGNGFSIQDVDESDNTWYIDAV
jgi:hypothetical protein